MKASSDADKVYLGKEKEQLRKKEEQLREKDLILLRRQDASSGLSVNVFP